MESLSLTIANERDALPVLQAAASAYIRAVGGEDKFVFQMELTLEEAFTNILDHHYLPGKKEFITLILKKVSHVLDMTLKFKGIPFDVAYLKQCEQTSLRDMINADGHGMGLRLISRFCDQIDYRNLGKEGQEIRILRGMPIKETMAVQSASAEETRTPPCPTPFEIEIRRMLPAEAAAISKLAYFAYDYSYSYCQLYDPEQIRSLNAADKMISYVAVLKGTGLIGHFALIPDARSEMVEMGGAFVDPRYRGNGCLNALGIHGLTEALRMGIEGVFVTAVTTHPYSQKAVVGQGLRESALYVSCVQPATLRAVREQAVARESFLLMVKLFNKEPRGPYYPPAHHQQMLERICRHVEVEAVFDTAHGETPLSECGRLERETEVYQTCHICIQSYGRDTLQKVRTILRCCQLDRLETIYLYLPLRQPPTAGLCASFEELGFFFCGLRFGRKGEDWLVLQYLNNQRYDYGLLKAATRFGQELIDYVKDRDPVRKENPRLA